MRSANGDTARARGARQWSGWGPLFVLLLPSCSSTAVAPDAGPAPPPPARDDTSSATSGDPRAGDAPDEAPEPPPTPPPPGQIDPRDQYALGREIDAARHLDPEQIDRRYSAIRRSWFNRRYRWEMAVSRPFCTRSEACAMMPFDHARPNFDVGHGYLPILRTTPESHARIVELCAPHDACVIRFEAILSRLTLSSVEATHLELSEINVLAARAARPTERWVRPVNVPDELVRMAREVGDAGAIRVGGPSTPEHHRLEALLQRIHAMSADGGTAPSQTAPVTPQSSTPGRTP